MDETHLKQINSAEMTAYWRSTEPIISNDSLSTKLVSKEGINSAHKCVKDLNYHCIPRLISVRARYFFDQVVQLLQTNNYNSCISFASGFSLLTNNIGDAHEFSNIQFFDSDLPHVIKLRKQRIDQLNSMQNTNIVINNNISFDLNSILNGGSLKSSFPNIHNPIIILEGISYFINNSVLDALLQELSYFEKFALVIDYFPENSYEKSEFFRKHAQNISSFIPQIVTTISSNYNSHLDVYNNTSVGDYEKIICETIGINPQLMDENKYFPTSFIVLTK